MSATADPAPKPELPILQAFAHALLDADRPVPRGLTAWNGSDAARRFGVYRNNVVAGLTAVLGEGYPVVRRLVGEEFFRAMARAYLREHPPRSPVMTEFGEHFADWLAGFEPAACLPYLADMARLERARVHACHAADAAPLPAPALAAALADPPGLPALRLALHPSLSVLCTAHAVVSLWAAHQHADEGAIAAVALGRPEAAVVLRDPADEVLVLPLALPDAAFARALQDGRTLGAALAEAPGADLARLLALLIGHGALVDPRAGGAPT